MRPTAVLTSLLLLVAVNSPIFGQRPEEMASLPLSTGPYRVGERLTFNVSFSNFISAAHAEIQVVARGNFFGREGIQLRGHVETTGLVNAALFAINNDYITYVDPDSGMPYHSQQILRDASHTSDNSLELNTKEPAAAKLKAGEFPGTYDFISAIYRLRALPLSEGSTYYLTVRGENEDYQTELKVIGHESIKTNVGSFKTLVSQLRIKNDARANGYNIKIYFSDDYRHVPVLITAKHSAGEVRAELAGSEFLTPPPQPKPAPPSVNVAASPRSQPVIPAQPEGDDGALQGLPFKVGEQLNYQTFLGNVAEPAGTTTFQVRARSRYFDRDGLLFTVKAESVGAAGRLFSVSDQINSYVDPKTLLPFRTEMNLKEGSRRLSQTLTINQEYGAATADNGQKMEIPVGTHDYLSLFYVLRTFNLSPPRRTAISILVNNKTKTLFIGALSREMIELGGQKIPAIQVSLTTDDPVSDKFSLRAWISDDSRRLPLRLMATTELGIMRSDLAIIPVARQ